MTAPTAIASRLRTAFERAQARSKDLGQPVLASVAVQCAAFDPVRIFEAATDAQRVFWQQPDRDFAFTGIGAATSIEAAGESRFELVREGWRRLRESASVEGDGALAFPVALGAF